MCCGCLMSVCLQCVLMPTCWFSPEYFLLCPCYGTVEIIGLLLCRLLLLLLKIYITMYAWILSQRRFLSSVLVARCAERQRHILVWMSFRCFAMCSKHTVVPYYLTWSECPPLQNVELWCVDLVVVNLIEWTLYTVSHREVCHLVLWYHW